VIVPRVLVVAITELVAEEVRADALDHLNDLVADIARLALILLADEATAERVLASTPGLRA
jgi:hypothetical protein